MSLEGDLMLPPRGPMKWRWLASLLTKLGQAAGIISPDESVAVVDSGVGLTVRPNGTNLYASDEPEAVPWNVIDKIGSTTIAAGRLVINGVSYYDVAELVIPSGSRGDLIAIRVDLTADLDDLGDPVIPRCFDSLVWYTVTNTPAMELISLATLSAARSVIPDTITSGTIYIPVLMLNPRQQLVTINHDVQLLLYHQGFVVYT